MRSLVYERGAVAGLATPRGVGATRRLVTSIDMRSWPVEFTIVLVTVLALLAVTHDYVAWGNGRDDPAQGNAGVHQRHPIELRPPDQHSLLVPMAPYRPPAPDESALEVYAYEYAALVYSEPKSRAPAIGIVRRGTALHSVKRIAAGSCKGRYWYQLRTSGYACLNKGFSETRSSVRQPRPDLSRALPFKYGRVNTRRALRYYRMPARAEQHTVERARAARKPLPDYVEKQLNGDYFIAIDRIERDGDRSFYRTIPGRYVHTDDVDIKPEPAMHGEILRKGVELPIAFVYGRPEAEVFASEDGRVRVIGTAHKHARYFARRIVRWGQREVVLSPRGYGVAREHVRIARRRARPASVGATTRWIHVDLTEQTLVAYRGDRPVFATLISSGRKGYDTPPGMFRIREKHKTVTMRGADPVDGPYEVSEVPWTMYYSGSYALHGAYWHDDFGKVRSHGCTNLSPIDARWLFNFTDGDIPDGWHARRNLDGTLVFVTRDAPAG